MVLIINQRLEASNLNNKLTQRHIGQRLSGNCTLKDIERISIRDGGASDHVELDDSRGAPNTISWWHEVVCGVLVVLPRFYITLTAILSIYRIY